MPDRVKDRMQTALRCCVPHQRLLDALEIMGEEDWNWVPVVETHAGAEWLGWITSHDAAVFLGSYDKRPSEVMCRELLAAPPDLLAPDMDLDDAYRRLDHTVLLQLPVVADGKLVGILSRA
ncbi:MAG: CBS domain-containing protein [Terriglobales bacterium]